jgi:hypothetical protein
MKTTLNFVIALLLIIGTTMSFTQCQEDLVTDDMISAQNRNNDYNSGGTAVKGVPTTGDICACLTEQFAYEDLNGAERDALILMREEEKMARDVYSYLYEKWNHRVFKNIGNAEERHMQTMLCLTDRYGIPDPVGDNVPGEFVNQQLAELYTELTTKGTASLTAAMEVGAIIEDLDIADLIQLTNGGSVDNADLLAAFGELTKGSRNHMRAFVKQLTILGSSYVPQFITEEYYTNIISTDQERGDGICADGSGFCIGDCTGGGQGNRQQKKGGPN